MLTVLRPDDGSGQGWRSIECGVRVARGNDDDRSGSRFHEFTFVTCFRYISVSALRYCDGRVNQINQIRSCHKGVSQSRSKCIPRESFGQVKLVTAQRPKHPRYANIKGISLVRSREQDKRNRHTKHSVHYQTKRSFRRCREAFPVSFRCRR